jgi:D-alanyl-D-alanine carboxypeptidase
MEITMRVRAPLLLFLIPWPSQAATATQDALDRWLDTFNSGDRSKLEAFWKGFSGGPQLVDRDLHLRKESGGFSLIKIISDNGSQLDAIVADAGEMFIAAKVDMKSSSPPELHISLHKVPSQDGIVPAFSNEHELISALQKRAAALAEADQFSGTILLVRSGKTLFKGAYGEADRSTHEKVTIDTRLRIGSMNKMFTAVAVLQLVEKGKLLLDAPFVKYWPDYPNHELAMKVTVRNLLTHTGGTGDIFTAEFEQRRLEIRTLADYVTLYGTRVVEFEPGSKFRYSNYGYLLLGRLIEKVTGRSYYEYVQKNVYGPAHMTSTGSLPESVHVPMRATGYLSGQHGWEPNVQTLPWRGTSAGGGYSTVGDLVRFATALQDGRLLHAQSLASAITEQYPGSHYGFGFQTEDSFFGHSGAAPGINGELRIYKNRYVIAVLSNLEPPAAMRLAAYAGHRLPTHRSD